ncbi:MAG TPA: tetratricopeptide repeat protein [Labilithrix sp.]|nr:tetratricopeptide repeat protein [Labilithrix sp.]
MSDVGDWMLISLDEKLARRQGVPERVPVPRAEIDNLASGGMSIDAMRRWAGQFISSAPKDASWRGENAALLTSLEAFIGKSELWAKAQQAFAANDYKRAISTLRMIASVDPNDHAAKMNLGNALANTGDHTGAKKQFDAVRETFSGDADYHLAVGQLCLALGELQKAADEMALALEANPQCKPAMDALVKLGVLVAIYEDPRDAASLTYVRSDRVLEALREAWDCDGRTASYFLEQLAYHEAEGRHDVALAAAERTLAMPTTEAEAERARMGRVAALLATGKRDEARAAATAELARTPEPAWARVELARCFFDEGKADEGRAELDRALALDPNDQTALLLRFWPRDIKDIAQIQACIPALATFAETHAGAPGPWRSLARAKAAINADDDACDLFARAVAIAPQDDELRAEYWAQLSHAKKFDDVLRDAATHSDIGKRDWKLRWNEAEAMRGLGKLSEARAAFAAINADDSLHVEVRRRAKRAVRALEERSGT